MHTMVFYHSRYVIEKLERKKQFPDTQKDEEEKEEEEEEEYVRPDTDDEDDAMSE